MAVAVFSAYRYLLLVCTMLLFAVTLALADFILISYHSYYTSLPIQYELAFLSFERSISPRGASVRLHCLSKGACLQCVSRGASVRLQDGCSRLVWFAEDSGLFWSDGLTKSITEAYTCINKNYSVGLPEVQMLSSSP